MCRSNVDLLTVKATEEVLLWSSFRFRGASQTSIISKRPVVHSTSQWRQRSSFLPTDCLIVLACFAEDNENNNVSAQNHENPQVVLNVCRQNYGLSRCVGSLTVFLNALYQETLVNFIKGAHNF